MGFRITPAAEADLDSIFNYILGQSIDGAERVLEDLLSAFALLADFPNIGPERPEVTEDPVRFWTVFPYVIVYRPDTDPIEIVRVLHGARDLPSIIGPR